MDGGYGVICIVPEKRLWWRLKGYLWQWRTELSWLWLWWTWLLMIPWSHSYFRGELSLSRSNSKDRNCRFYCRELWKRNSLSDNRHTMTWAFTLFGWENYMWKWWDSTCDISEWNLFSYISKSLWFLAWFLSSIFFVLNIRFFPVFGSINTILTSSLWDMPIG